MFKRNRNNGFIDFSKGSNITCNRHEGKPNPTRNWYGTVSSSKGSFLVTHESIIRSEAVDLFRREAKLIGGKLDEFIGTFK